MLFVFPRPVIPVFTGDQVSPKLVLRKMLPGTVGPVLGTIVGMANRTRPHRTGSAMRSLIGPLGKPLPDNPEILVKPLLVALIASPPVVLRKSPDGEATRRMSARVPPASV